MLSNRFAFAALGLACVTAAGAGGYLATRQASPQSVQAAETVETATSAPATATVAQPVQETEAVVGDAPKPGASSGAIEPAPRPTKRAEPAARPPARQSRPAATGSASNTAQAPVLDRSWPNGASSTPPPDSNDTSATPAREEHQTVDAPRVLEPPQPAFEELVVSADSVIGLQTDRALSSERAKVEDTVEARVSRDVRVNGKVAIPAGTHAVGSVMVVDRGGKFKEQARLGIRFHTLVMADGTRMPITTETVYRYGAVPGNGSAAKIGGGAAVGAILGAIIGGGKGAAVGAAAGAGTGTAMTASGDRSEATFPAGDVVTARILSPVTVTLEK
jgi:hypothetical protein